MKKHNGMRPQDIVILLKIVLRNGHNWTGKEIAAQLQISASEVSESLNRSVLAGLLMNDKRKVLKNALFEFIAYGLQYVFPTRPGAMVRGIPTSHSAFPLKNHINSDEVFVWAFTKGTVRGQSIETLYEKQAIACQADTELYEVLTLIDAIRIGRVREKTIALELLKSKFV